MIGFLILVLAAVIVAFGLVLLFRRAATWIAWIVGSLPAAWLAAESHETLADPITIFFILVVMWLPSLAGAFAGAALARRGLDWSKGRVAARRGAAGRT